MPANPLGPPAPAHRLPTQRSPGFTALIVDGQPLIREAVTARLHSLGAHEVTEAASCAEARARAGSRPPDLAVVELRLADGSGLDLLADLRSAGCARLIVLSGADDAYSVRAAFVAGAHGYLLKSARSDALTDGLRRVLDGGVYADPSIASLLAIGVRGGTARGERPAAQLSTRELEVLRLVAAGRSNHQIGNQLCISAPTVKSHLARIGRKLGTGDRAAIVAVAMRAGIIR